MAIEEQRREKKHRERENREFFWIGISLFIAIPFIFLKTFVFDEYTWYEVARILIVIDIKDSSSITIHFSIFLLSFIVFYFIIANPKSRLAVIMERMKRILFNILPIFGFDGYDRRNQFFRFGFKETMNKGLLYRELIQTDGIGKAKYTQKTLMLKKYPFQNNCRSFFVPSQAPLVRFTENSLKLEERKVVSNGNLNFIDLNMRNDILESVFISKEDYLSLFNLIDYYIDLNTSLVVDIPLSKYKAFDFEDALCSKELVIDRLKKMHLTAKKETILELISRSINDFLKRVDSLGKKPNDKEIVSSNFKSKLNKERMSALILDVESIFKKGHKKADLKREIIRAFKKAGVSEKESIQWEKSIKKSVLFSPVAISAFIHETSLDFQRTMIEVEKFKGGVNLEKFHRFSDIYKITKFYTLINNFMGLGSGLITMRLKDYTYQRVLDDFELYASYKATKQIKSDGTNDGSQEYDDREAKEFMLAYYTFLDRSANGRRNQMNEKRFNVFYLSNGIDQFTETGD